MESSTNHRTGIVALALFVGAFFTGQVIFMALAAGRPVRLDSDLWQELLYWCTWALFAPHVVALARRWPLDVTPAYRSIVAHVVLSAVVASLQTLVAFGLHLVALVVPGAVPASEGLRWMLQMRPALVWGFFMGVPFYWAVVGLDTMLRFRGRSAQLATQLARSQLDALRSQLRPHFLFNTLNAISVLTVEDPDKARRMVVRLGSLLRRSLDEEEHEIPLSEELTFLEDYLDIQRVRFGDRLVITVAVDPAAAQARVPVLMLQPLVENALEHGAPEKDATTNIALRAERANGTLLLTIEDNGPGPGSNTTVSKREGIGLRNTRERLRSLYGERATVALRPASNGIGGTGTCVDVTIPLSSVHA